MSKKKRLEEAREEAAVRREVGEVLAADAKLTGAKVSKRAVAKAQREAVRTWRRMMRDEPKLTLVPDSKGKVWKKDWVDPKFGHMMAKLARDLERNPGGFADGALVLPLDAEVIRRVFSPARLAILKIVRIRGPYRSVLALAKDVKRDISRVSRDLTALRVHGLVESKRTGKSIRISAPNIAIHLL